MIPRRPRRNERRRGLASLEFAMILPVLLLLLFGVMEFGWMLSKNAQLVNAAREGARLGARPDSTTTSINAIVADRMTASDMGSSGYTVSVTNGAAAGDTVTVQVTVPYSSIELTGFPMIPKPTNLTASVSMQKEGP